MTLEEVEIYSKTDSKRDVKSHDIEESSPSNFYMRMPSRLQGLFDRIKNMHEVSSDNNGNFSPLSSEQLNLNFYDLQNLYRYYSVDRDVKWISYKDYLGHLEKCTACSQCKQWCDSCQEYVFNHKWEKHSKRD